MGEGPFDPCQFYKEALQANGIVPAFGVPDSCLKGLLSYFAMTKPISEHVVTANEGAAVALAAGYYLSTRKVALAYMQNSGFANALNPLQSLAAKEVFGIPMLLMIGWRGKPGEKDEPEHALAGPRTLDNVRANDFPYEIIPDTLSGAKEAIARLVAKAIQRNTPVALIVPNHTFLEYHKALPKIPHAIATRHSHVKMEWMSSSSSSPSSASDLPLSRELAIRCLLGQIQNTDVSVSSVGYASRELYMIRKENGESIGRNFFSIGAMGHTFALAFGIAMGFSLGRVFCIDGDGSFLMHVGNNAVLAAKAPPNVVHIVVYNGVHCSTGSQSLPISKEIFLAMAGGLPYQQTFFVDNAEGLKKACESTGKSTLIVVVVNNSVKNPLPRPSEGPHELRDLFMKSLTPPLSNGVDSRAKTKLPIVFGAMTIGKAGVEQARVHDLKDTGTLLDIFQKHGHKLVDTARIYGEGSSEEYLGELKWQERGLVVDTKLYPSVVHGDEISHTATGLRKYLLESLEALKTDKIDLWYLHGPDRNTSFEETFRSCNDLHKEGYFNRLGLSNYMSWEVAYISDMCIRNGWIRPAVYQGVYNAIHRTVELELFPCLRHYGMAFYAFNPLAGGYLTSRYHRDTENSSIESMSRFDPNTSQGRKYRGRFWNDTMFDALGIIRGAAGKYQLTEAECALRWIVHHSKLEADLGDAVIIGVSSVKHLQENLGDLEKGPLLDEVVESLNKAWTKTKGVVLNYFH
jgi:aflatoxin B1 aldehyde reductase